MGIIIVDGIMVLHVVLSLTTGIKRSLVGCQLVGLIGVFATFASAAYHFYLSELITTLSKVFNPKDLSHLKYHFYAIMWGLAFSMFSIIVEDIGITVSFYFIFKFNPFIVLWKLWYSQRFTFGVFLRRYSFVRMALLSSFSCKVRQQTLLEPSSTPRPGIYFCYLCHNRNNFTFVTFWTSPYSLWHGCPTSLYTFWALQYNSTSAKMAPLGLLCCLLLHSPLFSIPSHVFFVTHHLNRSLHSGGATRIITGPWYQTTRITSRRLSQSSF